MGKVITNIESAFEHLEDGMTMVQRDLLLLVTIVV